MHRDTIPTQQMHAASPIVTRGSCCTKSFAEFDGIYERYRSLEQLVAPLCAAHKRRIVIDTCYVLISKDKTILRHREKILLHTSMFVCFIVGGAFGLKQVGRLATTWHLFSNKIFSNR